MKRYVWRPRPTPALTLTLAAFVFMVWLFPAAAETSGSRENTVVDLQMAFTKARFENVITKFGDHLDSGVGLVVSENIVKLDFIFPALYGLALAFWYVALVGGRSVKKRDLVFLLAPLLAALADYGENITHLHLLWGITTRADVRNAVATGAFSERWILTASVLATIKFAFIALGMIGVGLAAWRRIVADFESVPIRPLRFGDVLSAEFDYIRRRRFNDNPPTQVKDNLVGLALSGGGIRSATTCLGILQTLSKLGILPLVDYMNTVSGGGYIGSCLSSLLTLNTQKKPLMCGDSPLFGTEWSRFPFNPEGGDGAAQIRHLRTHGSFLVTRKGVLKRETLRGVGQLLSGTVYHLVLAALTLSTIALGYMAVLFYGSPAIDGQFRAVTQPIRIYSPALEVRHQGITMPGYLNSSFRDLGWPSGNVSSSYTIPIKYEYPGLWDRIKDKAARFRDLAGGNPDARRRLNYSVASAFTFGLFVAWAAYLYLRQFKRIGTMSGGVIPKAGESVEDALSLRVLRRASYGSLGVIVLALGFYLAITQPSAPLWLLLPVATVAGVRVGSWLIHVYMPRGRRTWTRDLRSLWGAYQATAFYAVWASCILAVIPILVYALREHTKWTGVSGIFALLVARALTFRRNLDIKKRPMSATVVRWLLALAIGVGLMLTVVAICTLVIPDAHTDDMGGTTAQWFVTALAVLLVLCLLGDANRLSPHYFYRDRLAEAYLYTDQLQQPARTTLECFRDNTELFLSELHGRRAAGGAEPRTAAPLHLISAAINLAGSRDLTRKDRKSGYFLFSKYFCGSRHTGYRPTADYDEGKIKLARAVTVSGAAASSGIGRGTFFAQAFATVLFNLRLGYWMPNPIKSASVLPRGLAQWGFWPKWLWREMTMGTDERHALINVSDGGHTGDNVGIYPLLQRRCKLIIACDAERDPAVTFGSFTEALRHAYVDLGIDVDIDLTMIRPDKDTGMSRSHCAVGLIRYPKNAAGHQPLGYLVYLKNSLTGDEPGPVLNYKSDNAGFPHESTADQFFDDDQFESYRALGVHIAEHAFSQWVTTDEFKQWRDAAVPVTRATC